MATKKNTKATSPAKSDPNVIRVPGGEGVTTSNALANLATSSALSAFTMKQYAGCGDTVEITDLFDAMKKAGDEAVAGDFGRVERMLANQMLTLDTLFNNLAQRSGRQDTFKGIEVLMRLALKAQAQARATAETLAVIKNPMPYIRQANIAQGHQQINNGTQSEQYAQAHTHAGSFQTEPNKLLEAQHGNTLDIGAQAAAGRADQTLEAVGAVHRPQDA